METFNPHSNYSRDVTESNACGNWGPTAGRFCHDTDEEETSNDYLSTSPSQTETTPSTSKQSSINNPVVQESIVQKIIDWKNSYEFEKNTFTFCKVLAVIIVFNALFYILSQNHIPNSDKFVIVLFFIVNIAIVGIISIIISAIITFPLFLIITVIINLIEFLQKIFSLTSKRVEKQNPSNEIKPEIKEETSSVECNYNNLDNKEDDNYISEAEESARRYAYNKFV